MEQSSENEKPHRSDCGSKQLQGEVFVRLLMEHEPQVRAFLRGLLPTWNDVDEVIQEASLIAWRKFDDFEPGTAFGGWLLTIARFEALKYRRRLARSPLIFAEDVWELISDEAESEQVDFHRKQHLEYCLGKLSEKQRALIIKVHSPGVVIRELAKSSGKSEHAFYKTVQRLRATVLACVTKKLALENENVGT